MQSVRRYLAGKGVDTADFGTFSAAPCDYPDYAHALANAIERGEVDRGIAICGSGAGISMTLNKHRGIRAAVCWMPEIARLAREHNDAKVLVLPGRYMSENEAEAAIDEFFSAEFAGGRHRRRVEKIPIVAERNEGNNRV